MSLLARRILTDVSFRESIIILFECISFPSRKTSFDNFLIPCCRSPSVRLSVCLFVCLASNTFHFIKMKGFSFLEVVIIWNWQQYILQDQLAKSK